MPILGGGFLFEVFDNDVRIPPIARRIHRDLANRARRFGDPFATAKSRSFFRWLNAAIDEGADAPVTCLWYEIHARDARVGAAYPDVVGVDRARHLRWTATEGRERYDVDPRLVPELVDGNGGLATPAVVWRRRAYRRVIGPLLPIAKPLMCAALGANSRVFARLGRTRKQLTGDLPDRDSGLVTRPDGALACICVGFRRRGRRAVDREMPSSHERGARVGGVPRGGATVERARDSRRAAS